MVDIQSATADNRQIGWVTSKPCNGKNGKSNKKSPERGQAVRPSAIAWNA